MPKSFSAELGAWKASVERRLDNLASGNRLDHASLDGTTLYLKGDGQLGRIGRQPDGSNGVHVVKVQPPPQLTAPILTVGEQAGTCLVEWDGGTFDGRRMPLIHGHTEIWAELVGEDWSPTVAPGDTAKRVGTIRDRTGGEVVVALPQAGTWAVWLRAMGADRETAGPWSPVSQVEIVPLVDTDAIEAELEDARNRLEQAEQDLAAGMADRVAEIEHLREVRIPALQDALTTGLSDEVTRLEGMIETAGGTTILRGTDAPTASDGDGQPGGTVFYRYDTLSDGGALEGMWTWDGSAWAEFTISELVMAQVHIENGTYGSMSGNRLAAKSVQAGALAVMPDAADFAPGPGGYEDLWTVGSNNAIVATSNDPSGAQLRVSPGGAAGTATRTHGPWIRAQGGDTIYYRMYVDRTSGPDAALRIYFVYDGSVGSWQQVWLENASGWVEGVHTVRSDVESTVALAFTTSGGTQGNYWIRHMDVRKQVKGVLIEPEGIKSPQVDTEEFFSARAVIDKIWADIVYSEMVQSQGIITEDMIATGAITTPKLTVTEEMVGEVARLLRIEAGSLASNDIEAMRIVSSLIEASVYLIHNADGDVSVRLDGLDNYLAGRLHAGMTESEGIVLDWGEKVRYSGLTEEGDPAPDRTIRTPYLNFHTDDTSYLTGREPSIHLDRDDPSGRSGMMVINPGYPVGTDTFRGKLNVVGDVQANRTEAREWSIARNGFNIPNSNPDLNTTISQESSTGNTYLLGRHHGASQSRARDSFWASDQYELAAGALRRRAFTWGVPPPTGQRSPILSVRLTQAASDRNAWVVANSSHHSATGYFINEHNPSNERATYYVYQLAVWEAV